MPITALGCRGAPCSLFCGCGVHHAGTSDLAGQVVGALVSSAMAFKGADPPYYHKLMGKAVELYGAAVKHKGKYSAKSIYKCAPEVRAPPPYPASLCTTGHVL